MKIAYFIKRRWFIFIVVFLIASVFIYKNIDEQKVYYRAEATLVFRGDSSDFNPEALAKRLREESFIRKVAEELKSTNRTIIKNNLETEIEGNNLLHLAVILQDPQKAKDLINATSDLLIKERSAEIERIAREKASKLGKLSGAIERLQHELATSQRSLRNLKESNLEYDKRRIDLERRLNELKLKEADLLKVFTSQHPDVIAISDSIEVLDSQLDEMPSNLPKYSKLEAGIESAKAGFSRKQKSYQELYESYSKMQEPWRAEIRKSAALPKKPIGRTRLWYYMWAVPALFLLSLLVAIIFELTDRKIYTKKEVQNYFKVPVIAEIGKVSIVTKKNAQNIKKQLLSLGKSSLKIAKKFEQLYTFLKVDTCKGDISNKSIFIASAEEKAGKSFLAANLALAAARNGNKVLLIDANFRTPSIDKIFNFQTDTKGLTDLLRGNAKPKDAVRNLTDLLLAGGLKLKEDELRGLDNLKILLPGSKIENPLSLLEKKELGDLFKALSKDYGILIIEGPSIKDYPDTLNMITSVDSLLLVARKKKTRYPSLNSVITQIKKIDAPLTGLVLTNV